LKHAPQSQSDDEMHGFASQNSPVQRMLGAHDVAVHAGCRQPCSSWM
jgi:hypothetical protein